MKDRSDYKSEGINGKLPKVCHFMQINVLPMSGEDYEHEISSNNVPLFRMLFGKGLCVESFRFISINVDVR